MNSRAVAIIDTASSVSEGVTRQEGVEAFTRLVPEQLGNMLLVASGAALGSEEPPERGRVERELGGVVLGVSNLWFDAKEPAQHVQQL